jgi:hypothetical protein
MESKFTLYLEGEGEEKLEMRKYFRKNGIFWKSKR